jgi:hypothetical protein
MAVAEKYAVAGNLDQFLKVGKETKLRFGKHQIFKTGRVTIDNTFLLSDGIFYPIIDIVDIKQSLEDADVLGVLVQPESTTASLADYKYTVLRNGDEDLDNLNLLRDDYPTISFTCVGRFYKDAPLKTIAKMFVSGRLMVVAFEPDLRQKGWGTVQ